MQKVYKLNKKRMIIYLLLFIMASSIITYLFLENTLKYKKALEEYDDSVKKGNLNIDTINILEKMKYDRDNERYFFRLLMTMIICGVEFLILYMCFLKNTKIIIDEEGIKVYSLHKRKATAIYPRHLIDHIKFQYADGIRGLISGYGMRINKIEGEGVNQEVFVPIERFLNYNEISEGIIENFPHIQIEVPQNMKTESRSVIKLLNEAYLEYKSDFGSYMAYSFIIFIFGLLNVIFINSPVNIIIAAANIYFGYRAKIAMNYKAYMSYMGEKIDFDTSWNRAKSKIGRYFEAKLAIGILATIFIGMEYLCLTNDLGRNYKILLSILIGIGCFLSIGRIYLITYIASIVDTNKSFMSLNGMLIKKYYKLVGLVVGFSSLQFIPMIIIGVMYYKDLYAIRTLFAKVTYVNTILGLFISPYISSFIMSFLELPMSSGGSYNA